MGNNETCQVTGMGSVSFKMHDGATRILRDVRLVPKLSRNLISLGVLDDLGYTNNIKNSTMKICKGSLVAIKGQKISGLYHMICETLTGQVAMATSPEDQNAKLWHNRLGHISARGLQIMCDQHLLGKDKISKVDFCEHCILGKQHRVEFSTGKHQSKHPLDYIHSDLWGPAKVSTHGGNFYFLSIIDDFSRKVWIYLLKHKSQAFAKFREWRTLLEKQLDRKVKTLRTDNGLEFCSEEFNSFCAELGIQRHRTVRLTPQHNGVAERMNRTLLDKARCMLFSSGLSKAFWGEGIVTAAYLVNRCPSSALEFKTPEEVWSNKPPDLSNLKTFGCAAYAHQSIGKLEPRSIKCVFLG